MIVNDIGRHAIDGLVKAIDDAPQEVVLSRALKLAKMVEARIKHGKEEAQDDEQPQ